MGCSEAGVPAGPQTKLQKCAKGELLQCTCAEASRQGSLYWKKWLLVLDIDPKTDKLANDKCFCDESNHSHDPPGTETISFPDESIGLSGQTKIALPVVNIPNGKESEVAVDNKRPVH